MINSVIEECNGLIYSIANKYKNNYNIEDLYQVGTIGVMKAYDNYKSNMNVKFSTYAYKYIMGEMLEYIRSDRNIKVSNEYYDLYKRYVKAKNLLQNKYCREPLFKEIADFLEIDENILLNVIEKTAFTKSIDYEMDVTNNYSKNDNLINKLMLDEEIDKLEEPARSIIKYRYFFGLSQQETAQSLSLSQSKVSREETHALKKMKSNIILN